MHLNYLQLGNQNNYSQWWVSVLIGWGLFVVALFLATLAGTAALRAGVSELMKQCIQSSIVTYHFTICSNKQLVNHSTLLDYLDGGKRFVGVSNEVMDYIERILEYFNVPNK
ncbi:hypothetical protein [Paenibacillus sp. L3-i20]|uniref:hypothetical protein n=1 Tax=Paenibacillus sp. L3-i20 TaxID=2905833 RepID=UPI001EDD94FC|nr:hypothetical protein [Paenibacillus sp. L3-i20]GKU80097.1 hypothetical protein L3i20_v244940 [Paenibacillus sp. L3-i20]